MKNSSVNLLVIFRIFIGCLLLFSGFQKAILPYQNFLYAVQTYNFLPTLLEDMGARAFPWIEIAVGLFLCIGLWIRWASVAATGLFLLFITVIGQALIRGLPIGECGCFGEMISVSPQWMVAFDGFLFIMLLRIVFHIERASIFSLDHYFE